MPSAPTPPKLARNTVDASGSCSSIDDGAPTFVPRSAMNDSRSFLAFAFIAGTAPDATTAKKIASPGT